MIKLSSRMWFYVSYLWMLVEFVITLIPVLGMATLIGMIYKNIRWEVTLFLGSFLTSLFYFTVHRICKPIRQIISINAHEYEKTLDKEWTVVPMDTEKNDDIAEEDENGK